MALDARQLVSLPQGPAPCYLRLYHRIRTLILTGAWPPGTRLPSTRRLAKDLRIARNTAVAAIDQLMADGWIVTRPRSGMFVSNDVPVARPAKAEPITQPIAGNASGPIPFEIGQAGLDLFPVRRWAKLQSEIWGRAPASALLEGSGAGWTPLRQVVASHLDAVRGLQCSWQQVLIVSGSQAAIDLCARVLGKQGDKVWVEDPGYFRARNAFRANGLDVVDVRVDAEGMVVQNGIAQAPSAKLAYVTAACQFPTGHILSDAREAQLLAWADGADAFVIEDDWDHHARFDGKPPRDPLGARGSDRVFLIHGFNRLLFPSLRLAALVVPDQWVDRFTEARDAIDGFTNVASQMALAAFIERGFLTAHLRACQDAYHARRHALRQALAHLAEGLQVDMRAGLHLVAGTGGRSDVALVARAREAGIACLALRGCVEAADDVEPALLLGFAAFPPAELTIAAQRLACALRGPVMQDDRAGFGRAGASVGGLRRAGEKRR